MFGLNNVVIAPDATLGKKLICTSIAPVYQYDANKKRTDVITGYRYDVVLAERAYEKIGVKIAGEKQMDLVGDTEQVELVNPVVRAYVLDGVGRIAVSADGIHRLAK